MANQKKAEVEIRLNGEVYVLRYGYNELCELEGELGCGFVDAAQNKNASFLRAALWIGMRKKDRKLTIDQVGNMLGGCSIEDRTEHTQSLSDAFMLSYAGETVEDFAAKHGESDQEDSEENEEAAPLTGSAS